MLLLTRPRVQSDRFAAAARAALGPLQVVIAPLIEIVPRPLTLDPAHHRTLIFTSENGVAGFCAQSPLRDRPAFCVGPRTAEAAAEAGFRVLSAGAGGGDAEALIRTIRAARPALPLLHLRGEHAVTDLAGRLSAEGLACMAAVVYAQIEVPEGPAFRAAIAGGVVVLPLFSPRSARLAAAALLRAGGAGVIRPVAISAAAGRAWSAAGGPGPVVLAGRPDAEGMMEALSGVVRRLAA